MHSSALGLQPDRPLLTSLRRLSRPTTPLIEHCRRCHAETAANCHANAIRRQPAPVAVEARGDDHAAAPPVAGIPVSVDQSTVVGERLWTALQRHPHEFVPLVVVELQQLADAERQATQAEIDPDAARVAAARRQAAREDVIYHWALAETYLRDPALQSSMRAALGRGDGAHLSDGPDGKRMTGAAQLLSGAEGGYIIGAISYSRPALDMPARPRRPNIAWGGAASQAGLDHQAGSAGAAGNEADPLDADDVVRPAMDAVIRGSLGQLVMAAEGSTPSRMNREGAARTYSLYQSWGYFQRRMQLRRDADSSGEAARHASTMESTEWRDGPKPHSSYGETSAVWRFFENVPDELSKMRTPEAETCADRHLRTLFGDAEECLTTLNAWQNMCEEARHFGRALFDAEELVLSTVRQGDDARQP